MFSFVFVGSKSRYMMVQITFGFTLDVWVALDGWPQALEVWLCMLGVEGLI